MVSASVIIFYCVITHNISFFRSKISLTLFFYYVYTDLPGLHCARYIQGLQQEAHQALNEHVKVIQRWDHTRFTKLIIVLSLLRSVNANAIAELFFRPIIGSVNMDDMLLEMLSAKI